MNNRLSGKMNLSALKSVIQPQKGKNGEMVECLIIPIAVNNLFKGDKGVYLDFTAFPIDPAKRHADSKDSHLIKQSLPKEVYEAMTEEEKKAAKILGNIITWEPSNQDTPPEEIKEGEDLPW